MQFTMVKKTTDWKVWNLEWCGAAVCAIACWCVGVLVCVCVADQQCTSQKNSENNDGLSLVLRTESDGDP